MSKANVLQEQLAYMYALERFGIKLGLETMESLMSALGHPERRFKSIHITGTNGKGSTAAFLASMLRQAGSKTGLYTSPHLITFHERIRVNGAAITDDELIQLITQVREKAAEINISLTFFEFTTAVAFLYFARKKVAIAVIEAGMGGLLDATNVITPLVAIITNISNDHMPMIGRNPREIAENKAGIIKPGAMVVTAENNPALLEYFQSVCDERKAQLHVLHQELPITNRQSSLREQTFTASGALAGTFAIPLLGLHQITNAATALLAAQLLKLPPEAMRHGLRRTVWPGRLDIVSTSPFMLVDGAHNDEGIRCLHQFLQTASLPRPKVLVLAVKRGKDMTEILTRIVPLFEKIIITQGTYEPEDTSVIAGQVRLVNSGLQEIPDAKDAIDTGKKLLGGNDMMLVTGSLYMIGAALQKKPPLTTF